MNSYPPFPTNSGRPLTSIKGWAVTLKEVRDEDRELHETGLDIIENECDRLTAMVEELLDFSRLVTGKLTIREESVQLEEFVDTVGRQLAPRAARDGAPFQRRGGRRTA